MQTKVSSKGQVVLPGELRRRLGLHAGDSLEVHVRDGLIVLTPPTKRRSTGNMVMHARTGLPALSAGSEAPVLTSKEVEELLDTGP
jgi:AbrB family looped-hinge helix DNA binding protein